MLDHRRRCESTAGGLYTSSLVSYQSFFRYACCSSRLTTAWTRPCGCSGPRVTVDVQDGLFRRKGGREGGAGVGDVEATVATKAGISRCEV